MIDDRVEEHEMERVAERPLLLALAVDGGYIHLGSGLEFEKQRRRQEKRDK